MKRNAIQQLRARMGAAVLIGLLTCAAAHAQDYSAWGTADGADGSEAHPYVITTTEGLDLLASQVNNGIGFYETFFVLGADITYSHTSEWNDESSEEDNYTRIGTDFWSFDGIFDGRGYTVSGIRIHSTEDGQGLFGSINGDGTVRNVILTDARITGRVFVGGIAGLNNGTIENCYVADNVFVGSTGDCPSCHGGIVGYSHNGNVNGCTCAATLGQAQFSGGIAGWNEATVTDCRAVGAKLYGNYSVGAIVGSNIGGTLSHNYYYDCSLDRIDGIIYTENIGNGSINSDDTENDGALRTESVPLSDNYSNARLIAFCSSRIEDGYALPADYTLMNRTLYKDGSWNTLCLPFELWRGDLDNPTNIMELTSTTLNDGVLTLNFSEADLVHIWLQAGRPYLVRWNRADDYVDENDHNLYQPTFVCCEASTATSPTETDYVDFIGSCDPVTLAADDRTVLCMGRDNTLHSPSDAVTLGAFRGYFQLKQGLTVDDVKAFVLNFGDEIPGSGDGVESLTPDPSHRGEGSTGAVFDLSGRRAGSGQRSHGIYVRDGRKVVE